MFAGIKDQCLRTPGPRLAELPGTHNDVKKFANLLMESYDYKEADIVTLTDASGIPCECWPTKSNIIKAMKALVEGRRRGDHIVFMYSGHGDQAIPIKDQNEDDGKDEILLPMDCKIVDRQAPVYGNFIRDDTIREIFVDGLEKGVRCTLIFDCCHSGTACDLPNVEPGSPTSPVNTASAWKLGNGGFAQMETLHHGHAEKLDIDRGSMIAGADRTLRKQVTSWSACQDGEVTYATGKGGIFINAFIKTLREQGNYHPTNRALLQDIRKRLVDVAAKNKGAMVSCDPIPVLKPADLPVNGSVAAPRPQLGSLQPRSILDERFTL